MEFTTLPGTDTKVSRICFGTWAIGGWMWGGSEEENGLNTLRTAIDQGINFIDTAPCYGLGVSEQLVGKVAKEVGRDKLVIATKFGLQWDENGKITRNCSKARILQEIDDSLRRLGTDYIDLYNVHWPDNLESFEETASIMEDLRRAGKIRAIGVSNYSPAQVEAFAKGGTINSTQVQYNIFERGIEKEVLPYNREHGIFTTLYSTLCRGMLGGRMTVDTKFQGDDLRLDDPKFQMPRFAQYVAAVDKLKVFAQEKFGKTITELSSRWVLDQPGLDVVIWGARKPSQLDPVPGMVGWKLSADDIAEINRIVDETVVDPIGPEFLLPPDRNGSVE